MSTLLADPPGRQGPGPMQGALVEALDLVLAGRASGALPGFLVGPVRKAVESVPPWLLLDALEQLGSFLP